MFPLRLTLISAGPWARITWVLQASIRLPPQQWCRESIFAHPWQALTFPPILSCLWLCPLGYDCPIFLFSRLCSLWCCYRQCWMPGTGEGCVKEKDVLRLRGKLGNSAFAAACQCQVRTKWGWGGVDWRDRWSHLWSRALQRWISLWVNKLHTSIRVFCSI